MTAAVFLQNRFLIGITAISAILYVVFAYVIERSATTALLSLYGMVFLLYGLMLHYGKNNESILMLSGIFLRFVFLCAVPNLSQDFYRYIWDGNLLLQGINPYLYCPDDLMHQQGFSIPDMQELYQGMGVLSSSHYSNYPPLHQLFFAIAAFFKHTTAAVLVMRFMIIFADIGILHFGQKLLKQLHLPQCYVYIYFLNPFIIIELTGNLHFEGIMLFFLICSIYWLSKNMIYYSALLLACAIAVKLIPLLLLPLFIQRLGWKKMISYTVVVMGITGILFLPFISSTFLSNYMNTIRLWFVNFEFNASWYYIVREIGYKIKGYNIIHLYGKIVPLLVVGGILGLSFFRKNQTAVQYITGMLFALSFYYFTSTTVHPWYIVLLVGLSVFTTYRFPILWSAVIVLSYSAYGNTLFHENFWLITLEYIIVYSVFIGEIFSKKTIQTIRFHRKN